MAKKKKQNAVGIFFSFFLKAIVIILGLVILAMGAYLLKYTLTIEENKEEEKTVDDSVLINENAEDALASATDPDGYDELLFDGETETQDATGTIGLNYEDKIVVLNGTETKGLAGAWKERFEAAGFTNVEAGNCFSTSVETSKIVVTEEGTGGNLDTVIEDVPIEYGSADTVECDVSKDGVKAFVIIGKDKDIVSQ